MAAELHTEGLQYHKEVGYSEEQSVPATFYVGLATDASPAEDASLGDLTELSDTGYARQTITSNSTDCVSSAAGTNDWKMTLKTVNFANSSGGAWTAANIAFLATSSDDSGKLIASLPIPGAPLTLNDGDDVDVTFVLQENG